jgi:hypothetical protein
MAVAENKQGICRVREAEDVNEILATISDDVR